MYYGQDNGVYFDFVYELVLETPELTLDNLLKNLDEVFEGARQQAWDDIEEAILSQTEIEDSIHEEMGDYYQMRMDLYEE